MEIDLEESIMCPWRQPPWGGGRALASNLVTPNYRPLDFRGEIPSLNFLICKMGIKVIPISQLCVAKIEEESVQKYSVHCKTF